MSSHDFRYGPVSVEEDLNGAHVWRCASWAIDHCDCPDASPVLDRPTTAEQLDALPVGPLPDEFTEEGP